MYLSWHLRTFCSPTLPPLLHYLPSVSSVLPSIYSIIHLVFAFMSPPSLPSLHYLLSVSSASSAIYPDVYLIFPPIPPFDLCPTYPPTPPPPPLPSLPSAPSLLLTPLLSLVFLHLVFFLSIPYSPCLSFISLPNLSPPILPSPTNTTPRYSLSHFYLCTSCSSSSLYYY